MSEKTKATSETLVNKAAPKPQGVPQSKPEASVLRWPSIATSAGGAYILSHGIAPANGDVKEG